LQRSSIAGRKINFVRPEDCAEPLHFEAPEKLLKSLQKEIRNRLTAGDEE
jgi:hypothetical protein